MDLSRGLGDVYKRQGEFRELAGLIEGAETPWDAAHDIAVHAVARRAAGLA
jgi:hypothetical protein